MDTKETKGLVKCIECKHFCKSIKSPKFFAAGKELPPSSPGFMFNTTQFVCGCYDAALQETAWSAYTGSYVRVSYPSISSVNKDGNCKFFEKKDEVAPLKVVPHCAATYEEMEEYFAGGLQVKHKYVGGRFMDDQIASDKRVSNTPPEEVYRVIKQFLDGLEATMQALFKPVLGTIEGLHEIAEARLAKLEKEQRESETLDFACQYKDLEADKKRMDWLEQNRGALVKRAYAMLAPGNLDYPPIVNVRQVIDEAMEELAEREEKRAGE